MRIWRGGKNTSRWTSSGGLTLFVIHYGHAKTHIWQDGDDETQTPISCIPFPPSSPRRGLVSRVGGTVPILPCRIVALQLTASGHCWMDASALSCTHRDHLPAFCAAFLPPFELHNKFCHLFYFLPHEEPLPQTSSSNITLCRRRSSHTCSYHGGDTIVVPPGQSLCIATRIHTTAEHQGFCSGHVYVVVTGNGRNDTMIRLAYLNKRRRLCDTSFAGTLNRASKLRWLRVASWLVR